MRRRKPANIKPPEKLPIPPKSNTRQVGGEHYGLTAFQHWDYAALRNLDYFQGQISKYVERWRDKNGIQDLEKAAHYLEKYIELARAGIVKPRANKEKENNEK